MIILSANEVPNDLLEYFEPVNLLQKTDMLNVATEPYPGAHYATFPTKLVEPCILAGTSQKGCCPACGAGWERVVEKTDRGFADRTFRSPHETKTPGMTNGQGATTLAKIIDRSTTGYRPTCTCYYGPAYPEPVPAIVLDPFAGSGTTGKVAHDLGRRFVGIDLSPKYIAENAMPRAEGLTSQKAVEALPLFAGLQGSAND